MITVLSLFISNINVREHNVDWQIQVWVCVGRILTDLFRFLSGLRDLFGPAVVLDHLQLNVATELA